MTASKYRKFNGERFELQYIATTKSNALKEVRLRNKSPSFKMEKYRVVPIDASRLDADRFFGVRTAYAIYGR
jgi:hypothetical protein